jgi:hypothetical protein
MEGIKSMVSADFLIGADLSVQLACYGSDIEDHPLLELIYPRLDNFPKGGK